MHGWKIENKEENKKWKTTLEQRIGSQDATRVSQAEGHVTPAVGDSGRHGSGGDGSGGDGSSGDGFGGDGLGGDGSEIIVNPPCQPTHYAIGGEVELILRKNDESEKEGEKEDERNGDSIFHEGVHMAIFQIDFIGIDHFWASMKRCIDNYKVLEGRHNALTDRERRERKDLLQALFETILPDTGGNLALCSALIITADAGQHEKWLKAFPPFKWTFACVERTSVPEVEWLDKLQDNADKLPKASCIAISDHGDSPMAGQGEITPWQQSLISEDDAAFLNEVFSMHHVPDAWLGDGPKGTSGPEPLPFVLTDGFSFEFDESQLVEGKLRLTDSDLKPYPKLRHAYCRTEPNEYEIFDPFAVDKTDDGNSFYLFQRGTPRGYVFRLDKEDLLVTTWMHVSPPSLLDASVEKLPAKYVETFGLQEPLLQVPKPKQGSSDTFNDKENRENGGPLKTRQHLGRRPVLGDLTPKPKPKPKPKLKPKKNG